MLWQCYYQQGAADPSGVSGFLHQIQQHAAIRRGQFQFAGRGGQPRVVGDGARLLRHQLG